MVGWLVAVRGGKKQWFFKLEIWFLMVFMVLDLSLESQKYGSLKTRLYTDKGSVDVDVVDLRAQADASMPASNNNVSYTVYSNF